MANRPCIQRCDFVDYPDREVTHGFRAYDGSGQMYLNTATPEVLTLEPLEFLSWVVANSSDQTLLDMLDWIRENQDGLYIDDTWLSWEEIRPVLAP
jgi:hypothetical protein